MNPFNNTVNRSPHGIAAKASGVLRGFAKTWVSSGWVAQSTYATLSAHAAEAARRLAPNRMSKRFRTIIPSSARVLAEPLLPLSRPEMFGSKRAKDRDSRNGTGRMAGYLASG